MVLTITQRRASVPTREPVKRKAGSAPHRAVEIGSPWTAERMERLRKLWPNHTATEIADRLGGITRAAVIGKARRMGLPRKPNPAKGGGR